MPISKADVGGSGVLRMRICDHGAEPKGRLSCAVCNLRSLVASTADEFDIDVTSAWADEAWELPLCCTRELKTPAKESVISNWNALSTANTDLSGHSARRSEAK